MIIVLRTDATDGQAEHIRERIAKAGLTPHVSKGVERTLIMVIGDERKLDTYSVETMPGVVQAPAY